MAKSKNTNNPAPAAPAANAPAAPVDPRIAAAIAKAKEERKSAAKGHAPISPWELGDYAVTIVAMKPNQPTRFGKPCVLLTYIVDETGEERVSVVPASAKETALTLRKGDKVAVSYAGKVPNPTGEGADVHDLTLVLI